MLTEDVIKSNSNLKKKQVYDPNDIKIDQLNVNLGYLLEKIEHDEIDLNPDFQREGNLWDKKKQSQLIESILLGLPLPSFYLSIDAKTKKWQIVDGLQRLNTLSAFWNEKLTLKGLEVLFNYEGKKKEDLTRADLRKIIAFKVDIYVIDSSTPQNTKFLIFKRINTGGLTLNQQEIRHALNQGIPYEFLNELAELESFKVATGYKIKSKRQKDRNFVNRFVSFYLLGYEENYQGDMNSFLTAGMKHLDEISGNERAQLKEAFDQSMKTCYKIFGQDCFRKRYNDKDKRSPISKTLFDSIGVNIALLENEQRKILVQKEAQFKELLKKLMSDKKFHKSITSGTATKSKVAQRFNDIKNLIQTLIPKNQLAS